MPLPFLRIGLANVVILYLLMEREFVMALVVSVAKTVLGGLASLTLLSPATLLSLAGGTGALVMMWLMLVSGMRFSILGVSMVGAVMHNIMQVLLVRWLIIPKDSVYFLIPLLGLIGLVMGLVTGIITYELRQRLVFRNPMEETAA